MNKEYIIANIIVTDNYCWEWKWSLTSAGYGQIGRSPWTAHKLAFELWHGKTYFLLRHKCHNRKCCNPYHVIPGTNKDNWNDSKNKHLETRANRRGLLAHNRHKIIFREIKFESKIEASRFFGVSQRTVAKECTIL